MNYTTEYILFRLGVIGREYIIKLSDIEVMKRDSPDPDLVDISTSQNLDDHEFDKLVLKFVDASKLTVDGIMPILRDVVITKNGETAKSLLLGLYWMSYVLEFYKTRNPISNLYYNLDYLYGDAIPEGYASKRDVDKYLVQWCNENAG